MAHDVCENCVLLNTFRVDYTIHYVSALILEIRSRVRPLYFIFLKYSTVIGP